MLKRLDTSTPRVDVADHGSDELLRHGDFDSHYGLEKYRACLAGSFLEGHRTGDLVRHFVRIDVVVASVVERYNHVYHRIASEDAAVERFADTLIDRLDELLGNRAALDIVDELVALASLVRS